MAESDLSRRLREALTKPACSICRLLSEAVDQHIRNLLYEYVNDLKLREDMREFRGFCNEHAWALLKEPGGSVGIAIIYEDMLKTLTRILDAGQPDRGLFRSGGGKQLAGELEPRGSCLICDLREKEEGQIVSTFIEALPDPAFRDLFAESEGLCLPHTIMTFDTVRSAEHFELLRKLQLDRWTDLRDQLREYIRKNDYRYTGEPLGEEGDSWRRVIRDVMGERGLHK